MARLPFIPLSLLLIQMSGACAFAQKVTPGSPAHLKQAAEKIDTHIAAVYKRKQLKPPALVDDATFLRRTSLVTTGRIPTLDETRQFLASTSPHKRDQVIAYYLQSPGYNSHMTNWMMDLLRVRERFTNRNSTASAYMQWTRNAIRDNKPWDAITTELITAEGSIWQNGAVGYYIRDKGMPLDNLANTTRIFLGTRMECAQCHHHPYDQWKRRDYLRLAAFTNNQKEINRSVFDTVRKAAREDRKSPYAKLVESIGDNIYYTSLSGGGSGRLKLPSDYQYRDGDPGEWIGARAPYGKSYRMSDRKDRDDGKEKLAEWITSPENTRYPATIANRMWERVMGKGIFVSTDQFTEHSKTSSPELTRSLALLMRELDYDLKKFQHVLLLTRYYRSVSTAEESDLFPGRPIRRMSAEQLWDSLLTLSLGNPDQLPTRTFSPQSYIKGVDVDSTGRSMNILSKEILAMKHPKQLESYLQKLLKEHATASSKSAKPSRHSGALKGLHRASELSSPAPHGHLLREFGQSDRLLIGTASREANLNQVLTLLNGQVEAMIVSNSKSTVHQALNQVDQPSDKIRLLFLTILNRPPSSAELQLMEQEVAQTGHNGYRNIISALINSREFLFIR